MNLLTSPEEAEANKVWAKELAEIEHQMFWGNLKAEYFAEWHDLGIIEFEYFRIPFTRLGYTITEDGLYRYALSSKTTGDPEFEDHYLLTQTAYVPVSYIVGVILELTIARGTYNLYYRDSLGPRNVSFAQPPRWRFAGSKTWLDMNTREEVDAILKEVRKGSFLRKTESWLCAIWVNSPGWLEANGKSYFFFSPTGVGKTSFMSPI